MALAGDEKNALGPSSPGQDDVITTVPSTPSSVEDLDDTYEVYKRGGDIDITDAEAKAVLRKIDRRIVPLLFFIYMLQYLDKNAINFASVFGLDQGTHMTGQDYSWLGEEAFLQFNSSLTVQSVDRRQTDMQKLLTSRPETQAPSSTSATCSASSRHRT